jgi:NitT/TauT family transport system substrate-binding protein
VVTTKFLTAHPDIVTNLLKGLSSSIDLINSNPTQAEGLVSKGVEQATGKALKTSLVASAFKSITFTLDPIASSLKKDAAAAKNLGFIKSTDLKNLYDLTLLNQLLQNQGKPAITP